MKQFLKYHYKAVIFDLDGTLIDSMHAWDHICRDWLIAKNIIPEDTLEQKIVSMTLSESAEYVSQWYAIPLSPSLIKKEWEDMVLYQYKHTIALKDGAMELVKFFAEKGMKLGIATSCFPAACESILVRYDLRNYFSSILYSDTVKRNKTFPDLYFACAEVLGVESKDCVVFEDFYPALSGIKSAGMDAVAVYDKSGALDWERFSKEADYAVLSLREMVG